MLNLGNLAEDSIIDFMWYTNDGDGAAVSRSVDGTVSVYKANNTTQTIAGITDTKDFDDVVGLNHCRIDTSVDAFYETGNDYMVALTEATIDGQTVNAILAHFSLENRYNSILANQTLILEDLEDVKGTGFVKDTNSLVDLTAVTPINVTVETTVQE